MFETTSGQASLKDSRYAPTGKTAIPYSVDDNTLSPRRIRPARQACPITPAASDGIPRC